MPVSTELQHRLLVARLGGEIDHHHARVLRESIDKAVFRTGVKALELNFQDVTFMDSSGIGLIMGRYRLMQDLGGKLYVTNVAVAFQRVMVLAGLDRLSVLRRPPDALLYPGEEDFGAENDQKEVSGVEGQQHNESGVRCNQP